MQTKTALHVCFGRQSLSDARIYFWRTQFQRGCVQIVDLHRRAKRKSGRSRANVRLVESLVTDDRRITIPRIMAETGIKHTTVQCVLKLDLHLTKKCAKFVPTLLTDHHIQRRQAICDFWSRLRIRSPAVFRCAITMDESWVYCWDPDTKEHSREWLRRLEPCPQIPRRTIGIQKVMLVTFFDSKGLVYREFVRRPRTVNQITFRQIITRFDIAFQNRHPYRSVGGCHFIHMDNVPAHIAGLTRQHLTNLGWTVLPHPACSPDLAPNDFWYYPRLKAGIKGRRFDNLDDLEQAVDEQIGSITAQEYEQCMLVKWPSRWRKCLTQQGRYFEGVV